MWSFKDIPIKQKLVRAIMLTSTVVLLISASAFIVFEFISIRTFMHRMFTIRAQVVGNSSTAAVRFDDEQDATEILSALRADPSLAVAAIYKDSRLFAYFPTNLNAARDLPAVPLRSHYQFKGGYYSLFEPIVLDNKEIGTLYLKASLDPMYARLQMYTVLALLVLGASVLAAYMLSSFLQEIISRPVLELAKTARMISERKDFSVRARKYGADELGLLTDAFNEMLTEIHNRDLALLESRKRLDLALKGSQTGTWDWDIKKEQLIWDDYTHALFGVRPGEFPGTFEAFEQRVHPEDRERVKLAARRAIEQKVEFDLAFRILLPDGSERYLVSRGSPFYSEQGEPDRLAGVCMDMTERKRAEEEIRRLNTELEQRVVLRTAELAATNRELEAFTYSVSHDLRAPLRHIDGFAQILQEELGQNAEPSALHYLRRIRKGTQNMGKLVDDLLNFARVGRQELQRQLTDLNAIVDEVILDLKPECDGRQIQWLIGRLPPGFCDPALIKQVFTNLISNAIKYTRLRDQARIEIRTVTVDGETAIVIRDNGVGFDMKYIDKVFGVFQRLHRAEEFEGTGVGLATVQRIVQRHGGRIWAEAAVDSGAAFYCTLGGVAPVSTPAGKPAAS